MPGFSNRIPHVPSVFSGHRPENVCRIFHDVHPIAQPSVTRIISAAKLDFHLLHIMIPALPNMLGLPCQYEAQTYQKYLCFIFYRYYRYEQRQNVLMVCGSLFGFNISSMSAWIGTSQYNGFFHSPNGDLQIPYVTELNLTSREGSQPPCPLHLLETLLRLGS